MFLVVLVAFIILGSVPEGIPAIVLFGPLLFPIAIQVGVHEVHYAMVVILAMGIGLFSSFPGSIYSGATRLIAFTVLPAGFVVLAPVDFVREPTPAHLAIAAAAAMGYAALAMLVFDIGLRRYQRG
jgi:ABC-type uncharacterized transport system permease subunit